MTNNDYKELKYLKNEIAMLKSDIKELRNTLKSPKFGVTSQKSGVSDTVGRVVEVIAEKEMLLNEALLRCVKKENEMIAEIYKVEDSRIRQILKCKYIDGLSWLQMGQRLGVSQESLKMALKRWEKVRGNSE